MNISQQWMKDTTMEEIECLLRRSQIQYQEQIVPDADAISGIGFGSQEPKEPPKESSTTHIIRRGKGKGKGRKLFSMHKSSYNDAKRDDDDGDVLVSTSGPQAAARAQEQTQREQAGVGGAPEKGGRKLLHCLVAPENLRSDICEQLSQILPQYMFKYDTLVTIITSDRENIIYQQFISFLNPLALKEKKKLYEKYIST